MCRKPFPPNQRNSVTKFFTTIFFKHSTYGPLFLEYLRRHTFFANIFADTGFSRISSETHVFREYLRRHRFFANIFGDTRFSWISSQTHVFREYFADIRLLRISSQTLVFREYLREKFLPVHIGAQVGFFTTDAKRLIIRKF